MTYRLGMDRRGKLAGHVAQCEQATKVFPVEVVL